jgi:hypothetical protein
MDVSGEAARARGKPRLPVTVRVTHAKTLACRMKTCGERDALASAVIASAIGSHQYRLAIVCGT